jgi:branched-chain amino acid transport system permease protein
VKLFLLVTMNGLTLAALYFIVASGFTLIFGLMRTINLAHGSLYLLGAYLGYDIGELTGSWYLSIIGGAVGMALAGVLIQLALTGWMQGQELRQALVTVGLSIVAADLMLAHWGGLTYQFEPPEVIYGFTPIPVIKGYATFRLILLGLAVLIGLLLWLLLRHTKTGMMIRAGVDDRQMLDALGVNVPMVFLVVFALGGALAGLAGVIGGTALSIAPGEDARFLLSSLVVVIVGGMGSVGGAAIGALLIGLAEQYGAAYMPTYSLVITFVIMVAVLAVRPQGILGRPA